MPFYNQICAALGHQLASSSRRRSANTQVDTSRTVTIEFDSNAHNLPWRFRPLVSHVKVHPGELTTVEYEIVNVREAPVTGQAVPSYGPQRAGEYFKKIECFCFTQQTLAAGRDAAHAGGVRGRPEAAEGRQHHRAVVHLLRSRGPRREELMEAVDEAASFLDTVKTVLWGMVGIRRKADHERASLNPVHVVDRWRWSFVVLFILTLRFIVSMVVN